MNNAVSPSEGQTHEEATTELHNALSVSLWAVRPDQTTEEPAMDEDFVPAWWQGDAQASDSFLSSMHVDLASGGPAFGKAG